MIEKLPIHTVISELVSTLDRHDEAILLAPPGAGKTTIVPLEFLNSVAQKILLLEPRRIAARSAAARMADILGETVGETVGYRMRLDTKVSARTKIEVVTEGVLLRLLQEDPELSEFDLVIFDEFHERNLDADLGLSLILKSREIFRERSLKLLLMSATLEDNRISDFLGRAPIVKSEGEKHPVSVTYCGAAQHGDRIVQRAHLTLKRALTDHPTSSVLVFLPGEGEIRQLEKLLLEQPASNLRIFPLYGHLDLDTQRQAIAPLPLGQHKVVLATNIAESSLTIEGVNVVVDCGLERRARFDPNTGMTRLETARISQYSATQRAGRAGRTASGYCYRLWSEEQQQQLTRTIQPEIHNADLSQLCLQVLEWGITSPHELSWLDSPPNAHWQQAVDTLGQFNAIATNANGSLQLTEHGQQMAALPLPPRLSHMLLWAQKLGALEHGIALAAMWSERDPFGRDPAFGISLEARLDIILGNSTCPTKQRGWLRRCQQQSEQLLRQLKAFSKTESSEYLTEDNKLSCLVALAFPDRIARKRHGGAYQLANGRSAKLPDGNRSIEKWLAVAEVTGGTKGSDTIRTAQPLKTELFKQHLTGFVTQKRVVEWDKQKSRFVAELQTRIGQLVLERQSLPNISPEERIETICDFIARQGLEMFKCYDHFLELQARCLLMHEHFPEPIFDLSTATLMRTLDQWLAPYLGQLSRLDELQRLDIVKIFRDRMPHESQVKLDRFLPTSIEVPSGSKLKINYTSQPPVLSVKLQEMFGCDTTPTVADGKVSLMVHLLSPAGRPLQITQDLAGFWRTGYDSVRKEMRGRYPKHPWPEDPTTAIASRGTKKVMNKR